MSSFNASKGLRVTQSSRNSFLKGQVSFASSHQRLIITLPNQIHGPDKAFEKLPLSIFKADFYKITSMVDWLMVIIFNPTLQPFPLQSSSDCQLSHVRYFDQKDNSKHITMRNLKLLVQLDLLTPAFCHCHEKDMTR